MRGIGRFPLSASVVAEHPPCTSAERVFDEGYPSTPPTQGNPDR